MDVSANDCRFCHSPMNPGSKYCQNCGAPVTTLSISPQESPKSDQQIQQPFPNSPASQAQQVDSRLEQPLVSSPPPQTPNPSDPPQPPRSKKPNPCLVIVGVIGVALICLSLLAVATNAISNGAIHQVLQIITKRAPEYEITEQEAEPTDASIPTAALTPTPVTLNGYLPLVLFAGENENPQDAYPPVEVSQPGGGAPPLIFDTRIVDDFSSTIYGWSQTDTDISTFDYDLSQGLYFIHVKEPSYISWSEVPVGFYPKELEFDAINPVNITGGSFGVMCQMQNPTTFYNVEIDIEKMVFSIAMVMDETYIPLTNPEWVELTNIDPAMGQANHYGVSCELERIRLFANGSLIGESDFSDKTPFSAPGKMAIFVASWENVSPEGYQVYFDNVNAWLP